MNTPLPKSPGKTIFHVPQGDGREEPVTVSNEKIDPSIVAVGGQPLVGHPEYREAAEKLLTGDRWKSRRIFVTSPRNGDGKTRTAFNLAAALAKPDSPVLLAEMNFTRPRFRAALGELRFRYGIEAAVSGEAPPAESVIGVEETGLYLAAVKRPVPEEALERRLARLYDFFQWANDNYRLLVLDCPPVISPAWRRWFHAYVGEALLVVREGRTAVADIHTATKLLKNDLKGAWFNREQETGAKLEDSKSLPGREPHGRKIDRVVVKRFGADHEPWSRETQQAVSVLVALASGRKKDDSGEGSQER